MIVDKDRPTEEMISKAWSTNAHGGGVAWRADGKVHWRKGLNYEQLKEAIETLPLPCVGHFRTESVGGIMPGLTHPFPIDESGVNYLSGNTGGYVLFHNGTWSKWKETMFQAIVTFGIKVPSGKWNDSRAMAFCAAIYGVEFLDLLDEKTVAFGPKSMEIGVTTNNNGGWKDVHGVMCSNDHFMYKSSNKCRTTACMAWTPLDGEGYCPRCRTERMAERDRLSAQRLAAEKARRKGGQEPAFPTIARDGIHNPSGDPRMTHLTPTALAGTEETIARNDAKKVIGFVGPGGASMEIPFAALAVAEKLYGKKDDPKHLISKKFLNKIRYYYQTALSKETLSKEHHQLLQQISPELAICINPS